MGAQKATMIDHIRRKYSVPDYCEIVVKQGYITQDISPDASEVCTGITDPFSKRFDSSILMQHLTAHCDSCFKRCDECGEKCTHPSGKCSGSCADCLKEIQYHRSDGRAEYDCKNMLRYYTCHTIWKRCSEVMYALETLDLSKYPKFNILSIGCGAAPDLMAFSQMAGSQKIRYHGVDIAAKWKDIHDFISRKAEHAAVDFERRDIYAMLDEVTAVKALHSNYNIVVLQYMIAGHIYSDRAEKIDFLFDEIIDKLIAKKPKDSPFLFIINDIDHKSWICDYFNLFVKKLRERGLMFRYDKRHFLPREDGENAGSKLYASRANKFTSMIPEEHREKYHANAPCSAAQLIVEVF
jgi:hypothetical protein